MKKITLLGVVAIFASVLVLTSCKSEETKKEAQVAKVEKEAVVPKKEVRKVTKFNYKPAKPVNGTLKGVVELGSSGFNSFIIDVDENKNWEIKSKEFGNSLVAEGMTNSEEVNKKLRSYIQRIIEFGVSSDNIHFVVSSGADKENVTKLIKQELKRIGFVVNVVTPEEEAKYALKSVLPKRFEKTGFVVDIGSGNTKISYVTDNGIVGHESYGAKYFQNNTNDETVYKAVNEEALKVPNNRRAQCFIIGGVPYQMAKSLRDKNERYTVLNKDVNSYEKVIKRKGKKVESGLNIFKAINDATKTNSVIFDWDANFTIGFLLELPN